MSAATRFVKICCISSLSEAELAIRHGAWALGLVSEMPSGPGVIGEGLIAEIARGVRGRVETVLLTSQSDPDAIAAQVEQCGVTGVQLCAWLDDEARRALRLRIPRTMLMQVVHVIGPSAIETAIAAQRHVDRILLDSGTLTGPVRELGGTGRTHDWMISRQIVDAVDVRVLLAGGLHAENVAEACRLVDPFGLDICSGVRQNGHLDETRLSAFFAALPDI